LNHGAADLPLAIAWHNHEPGRLQLIGVHNLNAHRRGRLFAVYR
jgi:hypothetical protein